MLLKLKLKLRASHDATILVQQKNPKIYLDVN